MSHLPYHFVSITALIGRGHTSEGGPREILAKLTTTQIILFPLVGKLHTLNDFRPGSITKCACAVISTGRMPPNFTGIVDTNDFHCALGHFHEVLLRKTAEYQGVILEGMLHECRGCSLATGLKGIIKRLTHRREVKTFGPVFVDLSGPKVVESLESSSIFSL